MKKYILLIPLIVLSSCGEKNNDISIDNSEKLNLEYAQQFTVERNGDISM